MHPLLNDPTLKAKVELLLSKMTLEQKIGQMTQVERMTCTPEQVKEFHIGSVLSGAGSLPENNLPEDWVKMNDAFWSASMFEDEYHLAIPILYGVDAIHGHNNVKGATIFPHNIGLGAANDPDLIGKVAQVTAREVLATGIDWTFSPNLSVAKDNRWGRTYESFSEVPSISSAYAPKIVQGLQKNLEANSESVVACIKHWVGDGGTRHGIDHGDTVLSREDLEKEHMRPYLQGLDAGALTIMASFSSWNGDKCHGSKMLLTDILKNELKFDGFIISDMHGIDFISDDFYSAVALGVNAGIDMFMMPQSWQQFIVHLYEHVELGSVSTDRINDAVRRILSVKIACGVFDAPRPLQRPWSNHSSFGSSQHREIAREAVRKSLVLLKNENDRLPLNKNLRVLVAGKNANNRGHQCGGFTIDWQGTSGNEVIQDGHSIWEGITIAAPNAFLSSDETISEKDLNSTDVAIVVIGEKPYAEGLGDIRDSDNIIVETGSQVEGQINLLEAYGSSLELTKLHPEDMSIIRQLSDKNIPIVTILISGRTLYIDKELENSKAFIAAWLPGSEGQGIADVIFGDYNFSGKLSFTWHSPSSLSTNSKSSKELFPFGYGLKY